MKKDEFGRLNSNIQDIRSMNLSEMSNLLCAIRNNPDKYPSDISGWKIWLEKMCSE